MEHPSAAVIHWEIGKHSVCSASAVAKGCSCQVQDAEWVGSCPCSHIADAWLVFAAAVVGAIRFVVVWPAVPLLIEEVRIRIHIEDVDIEAAMTTG